jgi:hypothetical protein
VNVNSIAPGIASALLATVVGLVVAIPALFIYSYLNGRIKNVVAPCRCSSTSSSPRWPSSTVRKNDSEPANGGH